MKMTVKYKWCRSNQIEGYRECRFDNVMIEDRRKSYYVNEEAKACYLQYTFKLPCYLGYDKEKEDNERYIRKDIIRWLQDLFTFDKMYILDIDTQGNKLFLKFHWRGRILMPDRVLEICQVIQDNLLKIKPNDSSR